MAKALCPNCGAEYDTSGIATICAHCQEFLPPPQPPPARTFKAPSPTPAAPTPSTQRRPCIKCGEMLYPTESTCWKCGTAQQQRPAGAAPVPPAAGPAVPPPPGPPPMPPPPPPSPYAAGTYFPAGPSPEAQQRANTALILSIVGILCCNILCPVALFLGLAAKREGAGGPAQAAVIVGGIGTGLMVLGIIYFVVMMIIGAMGGGTGPTPSPLPVP